MTLATRTTSFLTVPFTLAQLVTAIEAAMVSVGFGATPFDTFSSSDGNTINIVNKITFDSNKNYGQVFHKTRLVTNPDNGFIGLFQQLHATWDATAHTGSHSGREIEMTYQWNYNNYDSVTIRSQSGNGIYLYTFNHPESKIILLNQGSTWLHLDLWRPNTKIIPAIFDENSFPFAFISNNGSSYFYSCNSDVSPFAASPMPSQDGNRYAADLYSLESYDYIRYRVSAANINKEIRHASPKFFSTSGQGAIAQFSNDFAIIGSDSLNYLQEIGVGSNTHVLIAPRGGVSGITVASTPVT